MFAQGANTDYNLDTTKEITIANKSLWSQMWWGLVVFSGLFVVVANFQNLDNRCARRGICKMVPPMNLEARHGCDKVNQRESASTGHMTSRHYTHW
jgi:hypothetical protein